MNKCLSIKLLFTTGILYMIFKKKKNKRADEISINLLIYCLQFEVANFYFCSNHNNAHYKEVAVNVLHALGYIFLQWKRRRTCLNILYCPPVLSRERVCRCAGMNKNWAKRPFSVCWIWLITLLLGA